MKNAASAINIVGMRSFEATDFEMTYHCFIALKRDGSPLVITVEGCRCVCLFTDSDLLIQFHDAKGPQWKPVTVDAAMCETRSKLIATIEELEPDLTEANVEWLAIDATRGKNILVASLANFIEMLSRQ